MLKTSKNTQFTGSSIVDGVSITSFTCTIGENEIKDDAPAYSFYIQDQAAYRENRAEVNQDRTAFEDAMYSLFDQIKTESAESKVEPAGK